MKKLGLILILMMMGFSLQAQEKDKYWFQKEKIKESPYFRNQVAKKVRERGDHYKLDRMVFVERPHGPLSYIFKVVFVSSDDTEPDLYYRIQISKNFFGEYVVREAPYWR